MVLKKIYYMLTNLTNQNQVEILKKYLQCNFLQNQNKRISYYLSSNIKYLENGNCLANNNDPYILLKLPQGEKALVISLQIQSKNSSRESSVYFCYDKKINFSEKNKIVLGRTDGRLYEKNLTFSSPIYWLRLDPVDHASNFRILKIDISTAKESVPQSMQEVTDSYFKLPVDIALQSLRKKVIDQAWNRNETVIFVTHELSGTGAPLLCRKMSAEAKKLGNHTIIFSLTDCTDMEVLRQFNDSCDALICCLPGNAAYIASELSKLSFKRAVLNSVATGLVLKQFHLAGFKTVCLIHEMQSALKILCAHGWINDYGLYADKVIFPADCVYQEFLNNGGNIVERSVILPQGFYKDFDSGLDHASKQQLLSKLNIPAEAKLIIGAGSISFRKGTDLLPLIALELKKISKADYHFLWLGTSNDKQYEISLMDQIQRMNFGNIFHFMGYITNEKKYLDLISACDALALVSREDPYPSVMIEAMACRLPVVAFKGSGGAQDLLAEGRGFLVDYCDVHQYAKVLDSICLNSSLASDIKDRAESYIVGHADFNAYVKTILGYLEVGR